MTDHGEPEDVITEKQRDRMYEEILLEKPATVELSYREYSLCSTYSITNYNNIAIRT